MMMICPLISGQNLILNTATDIWLKSVASDRRVVTVAAGGEMKFNYFITV